MMTNLLGARYGKRNQSHRVDSPTNIPASSSFVSSTPRKRFNLPDTRACTYVRKQSSEYAPVSPSVQKVPV